MIDDAVIAVVVPAFDEEPWVGRVLETMPDFVDHVVVVDDGSRDGTAAVVRAFQDRSSRQNGQYRSMAPLGGAGRADAFSPRRRAGELTLLSHTHTLGVGAAIVAGYRVARTLGADVTAVMAGDGQMHPDDLLAVVRPVVAGRADYVKGDRLRHPDAWRVIPKTRLVGTLLLSWLTSRAAGVSVSDSQCGYTAVSTAALDRLALDGVWRGYGYPNDLIGACARAGLRIVEVPVRPVYRGQPSGLRPWHAAVISAVIARVAVRRLTQALRR